MLLLGLVLFLLLIYVLYTLFEKWKYSKLLIIYEKNVYSIKLNMCIIIFILLPKSLIMGYICV